MTSQKRADGNEVKLGRVADRPFWLLNLSVMVRAIHQVGAAIFLASFLFYELGRPGPAYLALVIVSGCMLLFTEGARHRQIYREVAGMSTFVKLILIGGAYHGVFPETITVLAAFMISSVGAHVPKIIRHRLLF